MVTRPKVSKQAIKRLSMCMRLKASNNGGTNNGIKAIWIGIKFWLKQLMVIKPANSMYLIMPLVPPASMRLITAPASDCGNPECAIATAKAPSSAYDSAICAPFRIPSWKAFKVSVIPKPAMSPPASAPINKLSTTCTRAKDSPSMMMTASSTALMVIYCLLFCLL